METPTSPFCVLCGTLGACTPTSEVRWACASDGHHAFAVSRSLLRGSRPYRSDEDHFDFPFHGNHFWPQRGSVLPQPQSSTQDTPVFRELHMKNQMCPISATIILINSAATHTLLTPESTRLNALSLCRDLVAKAKSSHTVLLSVAWRQSPVSGHNSVPDQHCSGAGAGGAGAGSGPDTSPTSARGATLCMQPVFRLQAGLSCGACRNRYGLDPC